MNVIDVTKTPLVYIDVETTGLSPRDCRVIEVGAIRVEPEKEIETYKTLINPSCDIPEFITKLTGITQDEVNTAPTFCDIASQLMEFIDGAILVAHNAEFDYGFLTAEMNRAQKHLAAQRVCTVHLARQFYPRMARHRLCDIIEQHNIEAEELHRAHNDAAVLVDFMRIMIDSFGADRVNAESQRYMMRHAR